MTKPKFDYDLLTLGAGSGGVRASRMAASFGARCAIVEEDRLGGTCVNVGCIPKKIFVFASHLGEDLAHAQGLGWVVGQTEHRWDQLLKNKDAEIQRLNGIYKNILEKAGVNILTGRATFVDHHTVQVGPQKITAEKILIATGSKATQHDIPGVEHTLTSREAFFLKRFPRRVLVVGGGYIAVEFAGVFHGLGSKVTLLHRGPLFLRGFDQDIRESLAEEMTKKGIVFHWKTTLNSVEKTKEGLVAHLSGEKTLEVDEILCAIGRIPHTADLGLEKTGVDLDEKGAVKVNSLSQTTVPHIYAVGDCTNRLNLTPMALAEGQAFAETVFNNNPMEPNHTNVPTAVFSQPSVGTIGLTEEEAREKFSAVDIYKTTFRSLRNILMESPEKTMMKIVVDGKTDRVLGCHMVGPEAGEIIQGFAVAVKAGVTKKQFNDTIGIHPTTAEEFVTMRTRHPDPSG